MERHYKSQAIARPCMTRASTTPCPPPRTDDASSQLAKPRRALSTSSKRAHSIGSLVLALPELHGRSSLAEWIRLVNQVFMFGSFDRK